MAYKVAINAANIAFKLHCAWIVATQAVQKTGAAIMATYKTAVLLCSVAYNKMTGNLSRAAAAQRAMNSASKANIYALLASLVVAAAVALWQYSKRLTDAEMAERKMNEIRSEAAQKAAEEKSRIDILRAAAMNEKLSLDERKKAIDKLNAIIPGYNAYLDQTTGKYHENKEALDSYLDSLVHQYEIEGAKDRLKEIGKQKAEATANKKRAEQQRSSAEKTVNQYGANMNAVATQAYGTAGYTLSQGNYIGNAQYRQAEKARSEATKTINMAEAALHQLEVEEKAITDAYGTEIQKSEVNAPTLPEEGENPPTLSESPSSTTTKSDKFATEKAWKEREEALNRIAYATGQKDYEAYTSRMLEIASEFYKKELNHTDLTADERLSIEASYYEAVQKQQEDASRLTLEEEDRGYTEAVAREKQRYVDGLTSTETYEEALHLLELQHLQTTALLQKEGSKEQLEAQKALQDALVSDQKKHQQEAEKLAKKHQDDLKKIKEDAFGLNPKERQAAYDTDLANLTEVYNLEIAATEGNAKEKLRIEKAFQKAKLALQRKYNIDGINDTKNAVQQAVEESMEWLESDGGQAMTGTMDTLVSGMSSIFSQLSSLIESELEIQTAAIEDRYDKELSLAEGNAYQENQIEEKKEKEIAAAKKEANRKLFAMQVIQAVAQTAQGAIAAYSSAAAVPVTGWILAPIAAAMALAAGAIQIAAIKKQQQASEATGYMSGGYTPKGKKDEEVGVVHAGEWVASQELLANPVASQMIATMDEAQRTNTIGSLRSEDVSRSITAPIRLADSAIESAQYGQRSESVKDNTSPQYNQRSEVVKENTPQANSALYTLHSTLQTLTQRLSEPFVTINTVDGDYGMKKAQADYDKLMRNKTPKSRR